MMKSKAKLSPFWVSLSLLYMSIHMYIPGNCARYDWSRKISAEGSPKNAKDGNFLISYLITK